MTHNGRATVATTRLAVNEIPGSAPDIMRDYDLAAMW
jgi:hypothetical protein